MQAGKAPRQDLDEVANHRAFGRRDDADAGREAGQRAFSRGIEKPFGQQLLLELLEGELQRAVTLRLDGFDDELILAALLVDIDAAAHQNLHAILRLELQPPVRELPADAFDLRVGVLESEVAMAAGNELCAGDFARDPDVGEAAFERGANGVAQFAQRADAAFGNETERVLFH